MLSRSDMPVIQVIKDLARYGIEAGYIVPTETGLEKGIMDAHESLRSFLLAKGIHDFKDQPQGDRGKVLLEVNVIDRQGIIKRKLSLYRPQTKKGDPRIWVYGLGSYAEPWNLLVLFKSNGSLFLFNASRPEIYATLHTEGTLLHEALTAEKHDLDSAERELVEQLRRIAALGFIPSMRAGPTGIGYTLETLLGIKANPRKAPDYHGVEIKASRLGETGTNRRQQTRVSLFSQVPDWTISACGSGKQILENHGYVDERSGRLQLYTQLESKPNSLGFFLENDQLKGLLRSKRKTPDQLREVVAWQYSTLLERLREKHNRTAWVHARSRRIAHGHGEEFHYVLVACTRAPLANNFPTLVEIDAISFDFTLSMKGNRARDHGYLFKIHPSNMDLLFPRPTHVSLLS